MNPKQRTIAKLIEVFSDYARKKKLEAKAFFIY